MNQDHHEQLALDAIRCMIALGPQNLPILPSGQIDRIVGAVGKGGKAADATRWQYKQAASLPDRIRDTEVELPDFFHDKYSVAGHNLSSFQHFHCSDKNGTRGYLWREDASLTLIGDVLSERILELFHAHVLYLPDRTGEAPPAYPDGRPTPMARSFAKQQDVTLGDFVFPRASEIAEFYAGLAKDAWAARNFELWRRACGFTLHFVHDALVPQHCWGVLLYGHSDWEDKIDALWTILLRETQLSSNPSQVYTDNIARRVSKDLASSDLTSATSVAKVVEANVAFTSKWCGGSPKDLPDCSMVDGLYVCCRAVASSIRSLQLMSS
jgi:hypothetical protein